MLPSINGPLMTLRHDHFMTKCGSALGGSGSALHMDLLCSGSAPHGSPLHMSLLCSTWVWRESLGRVGPLVITAGSRAASRPASSAVRTTTQSGQPLSCTSTGTCARHSQHYSVCQTHVKSRCSSTCTRYSQHAWLTRHNTYMSIVYILKDTSKLLVKWSVQHWRVGTGQAAGFCGAL